EAPRGRELRAVAVDGVVHAGDERRVELEPEVRTRRKREQALAAYRDATPREAFVIDELKTEPTLASLARDRGGGGHLFGCFHRAPPRTHDGPSRARSKHPRTRWRRHGASTVLRRPRRGGA